MGKVTRCNTALQTAIENLPRFDVVAGRAKFEALFARNPDAVYPRPPYVVDAQFTDEQLLTALAKCANGSSPDMFGLSGDLIKLLSAQLSRLKSLKVLCTDLANNRLDHEEGELFRCAKTIQIDNSTP